MNPLSRMKIILNEEEYMERLGAILKRDFFPTLQDEFTEPEQLTINEFQSRYTTEDNASFEELLERENLRKRMKFEKVYGGPALLVDNPSKRLLLQESKVDEWKFKGKSGNKSKSIAWTGVEDEKNPKINLHNTRFRNGNTKLSPTSLSNTSSTPIGFRIPQSPAREQLAHSLTAPSPKTTATKVSKEKSLRTPKVPKYSMEELKGLTPRRKM